MYSGKLLYHRQLRSFTLYLPPTIISHSLAPTLMLATHMQRTAIKVLHRCMTYAGKSRARSAMLGATDAPTSVMMRCMRSSTS